MQLLSKIQYKRDEKGEFHDIALRNCDDTIALVLNYPWNTERSLASIELTCPSVTIEHSAGTYLKIGPYFSGKYSVYYLESNRVYLMIADTLEDAGCWVKEYFTQKGKFTGFKKYGFTINALSHFHTHKFEYTVNARAILKIFWFQILMTSLVCMVCIMTLIEHPENFLMSLIGSIIILLLPTAGPTVYLFFNYLKVDRNHYLQISRGHDDFKFGTVGDEKIYRKQDIKNIARYKTQDGKRPWSECEVFIIIFKNGYKIKFSSLLIWGNTLYHKFPENQIIEVERFFPTIDD